MGIVKFIIFIALILVGIALIFGLSQMPNEQKECLEEIAEDYCEDNGMVFAGSIYFFKKFYCEENERVNELYVYNFLEDELEECEDSQ